MPETGKRILLIQTGDAPDFIADRAGNFDEMFYGCCGLDRAKTTRVHVQAGELPDSPERYGAAVITGSHDMVTDALPWMVSTEEWLRDAVAAGLPVLGVCFGHQLMAHALGGKIGYLPGGPEVGTLEVELTEEGANDPLFKDFPRPFKANLSHSQTVLKAPSGATVLAYSAREGHQALRYGGNAVSVQFHPEFSWSAMEVYITYYMRENPSLAEAFVPLLGEVDNTPESAGLVRKFLDKAGC